MSFDLPLVEEKVKRHQVTAMHLTCALVFIGVGGVTYLYSEALKYWAMAIVVMGFVLLLLTIAKNKLVTDPKTNPAFRIAELFVCGAVVVYSLLHDLKFPAGIFGVLGAAVLFALFWERGSNIKQYVHIDNEGIRLPITSRRRSIAWTEADMVLFRYGTLSIECTDNHRYQWNIADNNIDSATLEQFCSNKIEEYRSKRPAADW